MRMMYLQLNSIQIQHLLKLNSEHKVVEIKNNQFKYNTC